jgi:putative redox protein
VRLDRHIGTIGLANLPARTDRPRRLGMQTDDRAQQVESASVNLESGMHFVGDIGGFRVDTEADESFGGAGGGPQPLRFLLFGIAGCTAMDVISILRKKRQRVSGLEVEVLGSRVDEHPKVYEAIEVIYRVRGKGVDPKAVERAIELSGTRYCPAIAKVGKAARIDSRYEIEEAD